MQHPKLVVLYSTQYRTWNITCKNHIQLIRHLTESDNNFMFGIHFWNTDAPDILPEPIQKFPYKYTHTDQNIKHSPTDLEYYAAKYKIRSIIASTKIALENAKQLYKETYNEEMPDDQLILRIRQDAHIADILNFPKTTYSDNFYVSMWNSRHRPYISNALETSDLIGFTTKKTMELFTNIDIDTLDYLDDLINKCKAKGRDVNSIEHILFTLFESIETNIVNVHSLKLGIFRQNNILEKLTYF